MAGDMQLTAHLCRFVLQGVVGWNAGHEMTGKAHQEAGKGGVHKMLTAREKNGARTGRADDKDQKGMEPGHEEPGEVHEGGKRTATERKGHFEPQTGRRKQRLRRKPLQDSGRSRRGRPSKQGTALGDSKTMLASSCEDPNSGSQSYSKCFSFALRRGTLHSEEETRTWHAEFRKLRETSNANSELFCASGKPPSAFIRNIPVACVCNCPRAFQAQDSVNAILSSSFWRRALTLWISLHPMLVLLQSCMFTPAKVRVALIFARVFGAGLGNAVFFANDDPDCSRSHGFWPDIVREVTVGVCSALMSSGVVLALFLLQKQSVVEKQEWTESLIQGQKCRWRCRAATFWLVWLLYMLGSLCCPLAHWIPPILSSSLFLGQGSTIPFNSTFPQKNIGGRSLFSP